MNKHFSVNFLIEEISLIFSSTYQLLTLFIVITLSPLPFILFKNASEMIKMKVIIGRDDEFILFGHENLKKNLTYAEMFEELESNH